MLPWASASELDLKPAAAAGSDLARVQARLLSMSDLDEGQSGATEPLKGDGSLLIVKSASRDLSADAIAEFLLATGESSKIFVVAEHDRIILDNAFERAGLPRCGFQRHTRFRAATQVLKLSLSLLWKPVDPYRILQFLLHPTGPLPRWVRSRLADAVAQSPGIGGPDWVEAIRKIGQMQTENYEVDEAELERLQAGISYWLDEDRYDPGAGAPIEALINRTQRISSWATAKLHAMENETEVALFAAAHAQAEALLTELAVLRDNGAERIPRLELERRIDEVTSEVPDPSTYEEAGHVRAASSPAGVTHPWPTVIWWNLTPAPKAVSYPWSRRELAALRAAGVWLPEGDDIVHRSSREWLQPLCNATERLVLVLHDDELGTHAFWTRMESLFEGIEKIQIEPELLRGETKLGLLEVQTRPLPLRPFCAPRRWWSLPDDCALSPRDIESYSSLNKLCDYPHEWVLQYAARLRAGRAGEVSDGSLLFGNLGHRMIEEFFRAHDAWRDMPDDDVVAWMYAELPGMMEREGAVLLAPGRGIDRQRIASTLERALVQLLAHLRSSNVEQATPEASCEAPFEGIRLTGAIDLVLTHGNGQHSVMDVKWAGQSYRRDLLLENRALQLATYSYLRKSLDETDLWPPGAFFILSNGNVLANDTSRFPNAIVSPSNDGEGAAELWSRLLSTCRWRWTQLDNGQVEVVTDYTEPDERSVPPEAGLKPVTGGDKYDDFSRLTGWEDFR